MTSEIRANTLKNRVGLGTVSFTNTGPIVSGIVTANSFSGPLTATSIDLNGDLDVDGHTNLDNVSVAGVTTMSGNLTISNTDPRIIFVDTNNNPDFTLHANGGDMQVENSGSGTQVKLESSGSTRLFGNVIANKDLDVDGHTNLDNVSISGVATATTFVGALTGTASGNPTLTNGADNRVITAASANTLNGEANFTFDGNHLTLSTSSSSSRIYLTSGNSDDSSIYFGAQDDTATGAIRYDHSDDSLRLYGYNNSERLRINSSGNVGINQDSPQRILHVGKSGTAEANIRIQGGADYAELRVKDSDNALTFHTNIASAGSREAFKISGTTGHVNINAITYQALTITTSENGTNGPEVQLMHNSASPAAGDIVGQLRYSGKDSAGNTELYSKIETKVDSPTSGSETGFLDFSTRGGGAYNTIFRLKARGTASAPSYTTDDHNGIILDTYNTGNPYPRYFNFIAKSAGNTDSNIGFWTEAVGGSPTEKLRITSAGELWIKDGKLKLGTVSGTDNYIYSTNAAGIIYQADENGHKFQTYSGSWQNRLVITDAGNVGINVTDPDTKLEVDGIIKGSSYFQAGASGTASNNWHFGAEGNGEFRLYSGNYGAGNEKLRIDSSTTYIDGILQVDGSGTSVRIEPTDGLINFGMDGRTSLVTGTNSCYIFSGSGASGAMPAGSLVLQARSNVDRNILFATGSTPSLKWQINGANGSLQEYPYNTATSAQLTSTSNGYELRRVRNGQVPTGTSGNTYTLFNTNDIGDAGAYIVVIRSFEQSQTGGVLWSVRVVSSVFYIHSGSGNDGETVNIPVTHAGHANNTTNPPVILKIHFYGGSAHTNGRISITFNGFSYNGTNCDYYVYKLIDI